MRYRELGKTGIKVSEVGFGAWQLGNAKDWSVMSDSDAVRLVHAAIDKGCNFFDTAPNYGLGKSEEILGKALKEKRSKVVISTKFGHHSDDTTDYSARLLQTSVERSLKILQTDFLDSVLLHNPPFEVLNNSQGHFNVLEKLKKEGKIRAYGASLDWSKEIKEILTKTDSQVLEIMLNVFHQEPTEAFELVARKQVGIIVKVPLDSGWLSGKYSSKSSFSDIRGRWSPEVLARRAELLGKVQFMTEGGLSMVQAALRFLLSFKEVSSVIPGSKDIRQLEENISASGENLPDTLFIRLRKFWEQNLKDNPLSW